MGRVLINSSVGKQHKIGSCKQKEVECVGTDKLAFARKGITKLLSSSSPSDRRE